MIEPLPPELQHFVAAETAAPVTSDAAQAHVRAKLATTLGIATTVAGTAAATSASAAGTASAGTGSGAAAATTSVAGTAVAGTATAGAAVKGALAIKLLAVVLGVGAGAVVTTVAVTRDREPAPAIVERAQPSGAKPAQPATGIGVSRLRVEPIEDVPAKEAAAVEPAPIPEAPRRKHERPAPPAAAAESATTVEPAPAAVEPPVVPPARSQSQLLADASRALSLGDAAHALELIDEDTRVHEGGALVEEREALRISALAATGRTQEAREAARHLLATYPHSIHRRLAERVLGKEIP
ncbi:MAG TPA: hypothetical protein VIV40_03105 [Kofleriaceae bacterium]